MNRRRFPQGIGCMAFGAMAGGAMAAEAVKHEPRRPNLPYVFAVELRAQGLMESYQAVDVEALCAKRPNVPPKGTRWGNYYRKQILHCHAAITGIDEPFGRLLDGQKRLGLERTNDPWPKKSALHAQDRWPSPRPPPTEDAEENAPQSIKSSCIQPFCPCPNHCLRGSRRLYWMLFAIVGNTAPPSPSLRSPREGGLRVAKVPNAIRTITRGKVHESASISPRNRLHGPRGRDRERFGRRG